jgi:hypothetical protein
MRLSFRSPKIFNEPGLFLVIGSRSVCLIPLPTKGR